MGDLAKRGFLSSKLADMTDDYFGSFFSEQGCKSSEMVMRRD